MVCDEVEPINFPSVLKISCDVINGQQLDTRTQLAENLKLIESTWFKETEDFYVKLFYPLLFLSLEM